MLRSSTNSSSSSSSSTPSQSSEEEYDIIDAPSSMECQDDFSGTILDSNSVLSSDYEDYDDDDDDNDDEDYEDEDDINNNKPKNFLEFNNLTSDTSDQDLGDTTFTTDPIKNHASTSNNASTILASSSSTNTSTGSNSSSYLLSSSISLITPRPSTESPPQSPSSPTSPSTRFMENDSDSSDSDCDDGIFNDSDVPNPPISFPQKIMSIFKRTPKHPEMLIEQFHNLGFKIRFDKFNDLFDLESVRPTFPIPTGYQNIRNYTKFHSPLNASLIIFWFSEDCEDRYDVQDEIYAFMEGLRSATASGFGQLKCYYFDCSSKIDFNLPTDVYEFSVSENNTFMRPIRFPFTATVQQMLDRVSHTNALCVHMVDFEKSHEQVDSFRKLIPVFEKYRMPVLALSKTSINDAECFDDYTKYSSVGMPLSTGLKRTFLFKTFPWFFNPQPTYRFAPFGLRELFSRYGEKNPKRILIGYLLLCIFSFQNRADYTTRPRLNVKPVNDDEEEEGEKQQQYGNKTNNFANNLGSPFSNFFANVLRDSGKFLNRIYFYLLPLVVALTILSGIISVLEPLFTADRNVAKFVFVEPESFGLEDSLHQWDVPNIGSADVKWIANNKYYDYSIIIRRQAMPDLQVPLRPASDLVAELFETNPGIATPDLIVGIMQNYTHYFRFPSSLRKGSSVVRLVAHLRPFMLEKQNRDREMMTSSATKKHKPKFLMPEVELYRRYISFGSSEDKCRDTGEVLTDYRDYEDVQKRYRKIPVVDTTTPIQSCTYKTKSSLKDKPKWIPTSEVDPREMGLALLDPLFYSKMKGKVPAWSGFNLNEIGNDDQYNENEEKKNLYDEDDEEYEKSTIKSSLDNEFISHIIKKAPIWLKSAREQAVIVSGNFEYSMGEYIDFVKMFYEQLLQWIHETGEFAQVIAESVKEDFNRILTRARVQAKHSQARAIQIAGSFYKSSNKWRQGLTSVLSRKMSQAHEALMKHLEDLETQLETR